MARGLSRLLAPSTVLVVMTCMSSSAQAQTVQLCIGENANGCPVANSGWYQCGTTPEQAARSYCTIYTENGKRVQDFRFTQGFAVEGGRCGYASVLVTCLGK